MDRNNLERMTNELTQLLVKKNEAYGNAFEDDLNEFGLMPSVIQMGHKLKRIKSLMAGDKPDNGESITDSYKDLAGYCLLTLEWLSRQPQKFTRNKIDA